MHHSVLVLHSNVDAAIQSLREDAAAIRTHVRREYGDYLQPEEYAVQVEVSWLGKNSHYEIESEVCKCTDCDETSTSVTHVSIYDACCGRFWQVERVPSAECSCTLIMSTLHSCISFIIQKSDICSANR